MSQAPGPRCCSGAVGLRLRPNVAEALAVALAVALGLRKQLGTAAHPCEKTHSPGAFLYRVNIAKECSGDQMDHLNSIGQVNPLCKQRTYCRIRQFALSSEINTDAKMLSKHRLMEEVPDVPCFHPRLHYVAHADNY